MIEHTGWPLVADDAEHTSPWRDGMLALASSGARVYCKLSGLALTLHTFEVGASRPWIEYAIDMFGVDRCLFGSNFTVDAMFGDFADLVQSYAEITAPLGTEAQARLFSDNTRAACASGLTTIDGYGDMNDASDGAELDGVDVRLDDDQVATVTFARPPNNFFDLELVTAIANACEQLDRERTCRAIVLRGLGKHFCAGAKLEAGPEDLISRANGETNPLYAQAVRLAGCAVPMVAAVQGAAIGGGLGVALVADFRVASPSARFAANFAQLGMHHGFGITVTLPGVVGQQHAMDLLYTGRRVAGDEALQIGSVDRLVAEEELLSTAREMAMSIARSAPLAVRSIRQTLRGDRDVAGAFRAAGATRDG